MNYENFEGQIVAKKLLPLTDTLFLLNNSDEPRAKNK